MTRVPTPLEQTVARAICCHEWGMDQGWPLERMERSATCDCVAWKDHLLSARAAIRSLRDAPHSLLDQARGNRLASGDAAVFWNAMIDAISPPEDA